MSTNMIELNEQFIIYVSNNKYNEQNMKRQHLYSIDSAGLIKFTSGAEILIEDRVEIN